MISYVDKFASSALNGVSVCTKGGESLGPGRGSLKVIGSDAIR